MRWLVRGGIVLTLAFGVVACGGAGDDPEPEPACQPPGALAAVAVQGYTAPGTGGGRFLDFPLSTPMAAADGGWLAFVGRVTAGNTSEALYGVQPDGTRVKALAAGDPAPDASSGDISAITAVRVSPQGWILALVTVTGGGPTFGLVTVRVSGGSVVETHGIVYDDETLIGLSGTLDDIDDATLCIANQGTVFFKGTTTGADDGLWYASADGTNQTLLVGTGSSLGGVDSVERLHAFAFTGNFVMYAVVAEANDAGGTKGIYAGELSGGPVSVVAAEGGTILAGDEILDLPGDQPLVVYDAGTTASVVFEAQTDAADHNVLIGSSSGSIGTGIIARQGDPAPALQNGDLGTYEDMGLLHNARSCSAPIFWARLSGATAPISIGLFALQTGAPEPVIAFLDGLPAPPDQAGRFTSSFLGIRADGRVDVSEEGSPAYANSLTNGSVGVFWSVRNCGLFSIARSGDATPVGSVFTTTASWAQTTANGVLFFLAPVEGPATGLFRQGPP